MIRRMTRVNELYDEVEKCAKHEAALAKKLAEKSINESTTNIEEQDEVTDTTIEEELPLQDILAEERRRYDSKQEYVYLLYNDLVKNVTKKWEGSYLRKIPKEPQDSSTVENIEKENLEKDEKVPEDKKSGPEWKLSKPDESVEIIFVNGNSYTGRISRQKMEGQGTYRWRHGSQYKGEFEDNKIQGKGLLEWQDSAWYEGEFQDGYRHGKGTMVDKNYNLLYIGHWYKGHKHGKGYCRYEKGDSYDGDWVMGKREGVGNRIYPSGARYVGHWKNGLRDGTGTMVWPNRDVYRGEWKNGQIDGYGEYIWNGFFNKTLCWPQENCYMGHWREGTRHGKGQLTLKTIGGARYSGEWLRNKKHGYGMIIGNNGELIDGDPLFENNILLPVVSSNVEEDKNTKTTKNNHGNEAHKLEMKPNKIAKAKITPILKPEHLVSLSYYLNRLRKNETTSSTSLISLRSGKCHICEESSCRCFRQFHDTNKKSDLPSKPSTKASILESTPETIPSLEAEERWAYNCITMHMPRIREVYKVYSKIFCSEAPKCRLSMIRLSLWQLWRDCDVHKSSLSLVQIDNYLAANKSTMIKEAHCPFGRIEIWQLIHALLEVSWHFYTKNKDVNLNEGFPGNLANGLHKFLVNNIYPNFGKSLGLLCGPERDLLPLYPVYQLYESVGKPHSTRQLLKATVQDANFRQVSVQLEEHATSIPEYHPNGRNSVTVGEKLCYLSSSKPMTDSGQEVSEKKCDDSSGHSLYALRDLGIKSFIEIMSSICPGIKDSDTGVIVNMDYELTFLEFLEIFVESGKKLVEKRHKEREADRTKSEATETTSIMSSTKVVNKTSNSSIRLFTGSKITKSKKKLTTK